ncbi:Nucleolar Complex 2 protein [Malassezia nana]|uniref:Nucleolar Complex 2 protein n=1 Tax=Malassezia nana TaxID=180528 RepID=A0AAF0EGZ4_9BASI|nr:Nucleolar Complex 2 protein [Malassezia nana]
MAKPTKRTKKFVKNKLDTALQQRRAAKKKTKYVRDKRRAPTEEEDEEAASDVPEDGADQPMSVDEFLSGGFQQGMGEDEDEDEDEELDNDDDLEDVEDLDDESEHAQDLAKLAETDPEFYKYLQENDEDLLKFGQGGEDIDVDGDDAQDEEEERVLTLERLRQWQHQLLRHRSTRALRRLLLAFRAAVHTGEETVSVTYRIDDSAVYTKLVLTTLKYMPVVVEHHVPYKKGADGRFKVPTHTPKWHALYRLVRSYFLSVVQLLRTVAEPDMVYAALTESAKMVPYLHQDRRITRDYVRALLEQWANGEDRIRLAAFSCLYVTIASATDEDMIDFGLKSTYHMLIRHTRQTKPHTLEAIELMKNTACELFTLHPEAVYQQAFGFIRQLAISLRNCLKLKTQEQFQSVLNWPYVHCLDFWSRVLAKTCHTDTEQGVPSHMRPLIYPLVQVALGVMRLVPMSRYYPLRLHVLRAMLRLMQATGMYIPLAPFVLEVWDSPEFQRKAKGATLQPLDLDTTFRAPAAYVRTRVYGDQLADEFGFIMLEFLASQAGHISFPELVIPITVQMRRILKGSPSVRLSETLRPLLDKTQQNAQWVTQRRAHVEFAPDDQRQVDAFLQKANSQHDAPLQQALRLARKVREQRRRLLEKTAHVVDDDEA